MKYLKIKESDENHQLLKEEMRKQLFLFTEQKFWLDL